MGNHSQIKGGVYSSPPAKIKGARQVLAATTSARMRPGLQLTGVTSQVEKATVGTRRRNPLKKPSQ